MKGLRKRFKMNAQSLTSEKVQKSCERLHFSLPTLQYANGKDMKTGSPRLLLGHSAYWLGVSAYWTQLTEIFVKKRGYFAHIELNFGVLCAYWNSTELIEFLPLIGTAYWTSQSSHSIMVNFGKPISVGGTFLSTDFSVPFWSFPLWDSTAYWNITYQCALSYPLLTVKQTG